MSSSGAMKCGSGGVETGTTLIKRAGDVTKEERAGMEITLGDGATRRVGEVAAGTGTTVGVMAVVKRRERSARARSVSSPTVTKGATGDGLESVLNRFLDTRVTKSTEEGAGMTH